MITANDKPRSTAKLGRKNGGMTLEDFARLSGVEIVDCGDGWGGRIGYKTADAPNCTMAGYRTTAAAYKGWAKETFGEKAAKALFKLLSSTYR